MSKDSGLMLSNEAHLHQSIRDILTTPKGTRVMRLDYGSRLYELVDRPINRALFVDIYVAVAEALKQWERRITVKRVQVESIDQANITLVIEGSYRANNQSFRLEGVAI